MKTKIFILTLMTLLCAVSVNAAVLTVDNHVVLSGSPGQYSDLQVACTAAFAGDTILVVGSPASYLTITITKKLILLGPGINPQRPNKSNATLDGIYIGNGGSNSIISGLAIGSAGFSNTTAVANVTFSKNKIVGSMDCGGNLVSDIMIFNNIFNNTSPNYDADVRLNVGYRQNIFIYNNIFINRYSIKFSDKTSVFIKNNLFIDGGKLMVSVQNAEISNNIFIERSFYSVDPSDYAVTTCTFNNNLTYNCLPNGYAFPFGSNVGSGNIIEQDPVFLNVNGGFSFDNNYGLHSSSPAKNAGTDGTDIGPSGGSYPFTNVFPITGYPPIPYISQMQINGASSVPVGTSQINVTVKAKKQN